MRKCVALLAALLFTLAACGNGAGGTAVPEATMNFSVYEAHPSVPDFGSVCGYTLYTRTELGDVDVYAYETGTRDDAENSAFWADCDLYAQAAAQLDAGSTVEQFPEEPFCRVSLGDYWVYITRDTSEYDGAELTLLLVMVGTTDAFDAISGEIPSAIAE